MLSVECFIIDKVSQHETIRVQTVSDGKLNMRDKMERNYPAVKGTINFVIT